MPLYIVLGQQRACMPVYIGKSGDLVRCYRCLTDTQTTEYRATQLLSSIQFKLSHAIKDIIFVAIAAFLFQTNAVCHQNITTFMGLSHLTNCINKSQNTKWWWYKLACLISSCKRTVEGKFQEEGSKKLTHLSLNFMSDKRWPKFHKRSPFGIALMGATFFW